MALIRNKGLKKLGYYIGPRLAKTRFGAPEDTRG